MKMLKAPRRFKTKKSHSGDIKNQNDIRPFDSKKPKSKSNALKILGIHT